MDGSSAERAEPREGSGLTKPICVLLLTAGVLLACMGNAARACAISFGFDPDDLVAADVILTATFARYERLSDHYARFYLEPPVSLHAGGLDDGLAEAQIVTIGWSALTGVPAEVSFQAGQEVTLAASSAPSAGAVPIPDLGDFDANHPWVVHRACGPVYVYSADRPTAAFMREFAPGTQEDTQ